jgi:hypothetical protein
MVGPGWDGLLDLFYNFMHNKSRLFIMHLELRGTGWICVSETLQRCVSARGDVSGLQHCAFIHLPIAEE